MNEEELLRSCNQLVGASEATLASLAAGMTRTACTPGGVIFSAGDESVPVYIVEAGRVALVRSEGDVAEVGPGDLLGEMTALTGRPRTSTARAMTDTILWELPTMALLGAIQTDSGLAAGLMRHAMELVLEKDIVAVVRNQQTLELGRILEAERERAQRLEETGELHSEQIAILAHDIRSPVSAMMAASHLLRTRADRLNESTRIELLESISRQGQALLDLVHRTLQVTSIESGAVTYERDPFDIVGLARRVAGDLSEADDRIHVTVTAGPDLPKALGDEGRHWQVLFNLLSNAVKFSPPGAPISVEISHRKPELCVSVSDEGIGIAPEDLPRVFDKFTRLGPSDIASPEGSGLGLYICKQMVEAQGGSIWAESAVGRGSTFTYTLPVPHRGTP